jgi:hypothetical protein
MRPDGTQEPLHATLTVHDIVVGHTRLRVERDCATGEQAYFVDDQRRDVNAYLAVTRAHHDRTEPLR